MMITEEIFTISEPQKVQEIIESTERKIAAAQICDSIANDVMVALLEAVNNAIIHGNQRNFDKYVTVRMTISDGKIELCVTDQGSGFDPNLVDDPSRPENLFRPNGRGLYFIRQLMDEVEINSGQDGSKNNNA